LRVTDAFCAPRQVAPGQQNAMPAGSTFQANICANTGNNPLIAATGMWFPHTHKVIGEQVWEHGYADYTVSHHWFFDV